MQTPIIQVMTSLTPTFADVMAQDLRQHPRTSKCEARSNIREFQVLRSALRSASSNYQEPCPYTRAPSLKSRTLFCEPQVNKPHQVNFFNRANTRALQVSKAAPSFVGLKVNGTCQVKFLSLASLKVISACSKVLSCGPCQDTCVLYFEPRARPMKAMPTLSSRLACAML